MFLGIVLFAAIAVLCVVAFVMVKRRDRAYERGEWGND